MSFIRRILDSLGVASYQDAPRIPKPTGFSFGVACHINGDHFAAIKKAGFDTVTLDYVPAGYEGGFYEKLFSDATAAGLKVYITDLKKEEDVFTLLKNHGRHISWLAACNEPDLARFYDGSMQQLVDRIHRVALFKRNLAPHVVLVAPSFSALGSSSRKGWQDKPALIREATKLGLRRWVDVIGIHAYKDTPDKVDRYVRDLIRVYRQNGWRQQAFVSEFGWKSKEASVGQETQALYTVNTLAQLAGNRDVVGAAVYALLNDWDEEKQEWGSYGVKEDETGREKKAWKRITKCLG